MTKKEGGTREKLKSWLEEFIKKDRFNLELMNGKIISWGPFSKVDCVERRILWFVV